MKKSTATFGYIWAIVMILLGLALFPYGLMSVGLGGFLVWYIKSEEDDDKEKEKLQN